MELRELNRAFDQFSPTQEQKEAIRARLLHAERKRRPMKWMKKTIAVAAAAAVLLMACAFTVVTGLDQRILSLLGGSAQDEELLAPGFTEVDLTSTAENVRNSAELLEPGSSVGIVTNDFHLYRALRIAEKNGLAGASGLAAPSNPLYLPQSALRECAALAKDFLVGNL